MKPENFEEFRAALLEDLHRTTFESPVRLFIGTMDGPTFMHPHFGLMCADSTWLPSLAYVDIRDQMIERLGLDLLRLSKMGVSEYHIWIFQVPTPDINFPCIRYAKHFI